MAGQHGGYRRPSEPAAASGPGALSQRTDGGATQAAQVAPGGPYGSRQDQMSIQQSAPLAGGGNPVPSQPQISRDQLTPLDAPSGNPDEPVTSGAELGPGLSPLAAGIQSDQQVTNEQLAPFVRSLELVANLPGSNPETRAFVRNLKARLSNG